MKTELKQILIPFFLTILFNIANSYLGVLWDFGVFAPQIGILYVAGLLFGPYGAFGATLANILVNLYSGFSPLEILPSAVVCFGVSCIAYKIWYFPVDGYELTKPKLDNIYHLQLFLASIFVCGFIFSASHGLIFEIFLNIDVGKRLAVEYFLNFINVAFIFGIINIWIFKKSDFIKTPKISKRRVNKKLYKLMIVGLILTGVLTVISLELDLNIYLLTAEFLLLIIFLYAYLTKPIEREVVENNTPSTLERITTIFLITTLIIAVCGITLSFLGYSNAFINIKNLEAYLPVMPLLILSDIIIILFFIPGFSVLRYVERKVMKPLASFSEIEKFIQENEKIEAEGLVDVYSEYINNQDEIGKLARSYTDLIRHNNNYIENIRKIEGEKERIEAELNIATRIQASNLPKHAIETREYIVDGYSNPAKEVGGDFFDYYQLDDDTLAIIIGDASGKGIPAALLATITQVMIKQILKHAKNPSKVLHQLNNQLCENNSETMFITLWLGIYNKNTKKIVFSNAGHNPPIVNENGEFEYLKINTGFVLGVMEDFDYINEEMTLSQEIILYTDGITDANDTDEEMYGAKRLLDFFNSSKKTQTLLNLY